MLILTICLPISSSDTIYKYKDENGVLRFADHPPLIGQPVETCSLIQCLPLPDRIGQSNIFDGLDNQVMCAWAHD